MGRRRGWRRGFGEGPRTEGAVLDWGGIVDGVSLQQSM